MTPLSPALLIAAANTFVGFEEQGGDNRGQVVERLLREVGLPPGLPWCAAFVYHVGHSAHYDHRTGASSWPLPRTASCAELAAFAERAGVLRRSPEGGDVFLVYSARLGRFHHTGIVVDATWPSGTTIEGNTNLDGSTNGYAALRRTRRFREDDRFIRWVELDLRRRVA